MAKCKYPPCSNEAPEEKEFCCRGCANRFNANICKTKPTAHRAHRLRMRVGMPHGILPAW